jgi:L-threonylcarbamoyladenylate synthase
VRRIALDRLNSSPEEISRLRELLASGGLAAIPTETFYGLAADPRSDRGVARIFRAKERDDGKPLPVIVSGEAQLRALGVEVAPEALARWLAVLPAPLTVVFPIARPIAASRGERTLGVRVPASTGVRRMLEAAGPMTATSANRSGSPPCDDPDEVEAILGGDVDLLVDGGRAPGGRASTVVDATRDPPRVLRAGAFDWPDAAGTAHVEPGPGLC